MLREEIKRARQYIFLDNANFKDLYRQAIINEITMNRFPDDKFDELIEDWYAAVRPLYLEPAEILPLDEGDKIDLGGNSFEVMLAAGHSDGQCMFWSAQLKQLFVADVLTTSGYLHFTDWPNTKLQNSLQNLFSLFEQLKAMEVKRTFPGHGPIITDLNLPIDKLIARHQRALDKIKASVTGPISAGELYPQLYNVPEYVHAHRVTIGETLGYLNYLVSQGRLTMSNDGVCNIYMPV
jgi:glyoxylase-like metal-dependent hydrolase (beta-lactamase superfamily II)